MRGPMCSATVREARDESTGGPVSLTFPPAPLHLVLPAVAENIAVVRSTIEAVARELGLPQRLVEDVRLAVTEACTNIVRHAYDRDERPAPAMEVQVSATAGTMRVVVEDHGRGLGPASPDASGPGLGLALIAALATRLEIDHGRARGSRLSMCFSAEPGGRR